MAYSGLFNLKQTLKFGFFLIAFCCLPFTEGDQVRSRLYTKILLDYNALMTPNQDSNPVRVDIALSVQHVGQVNEADGSVKVTFGLYQNWTDESIAWNQDEYNTSSIFIPRHVVWAPDTVAHKGVVKQQTSSKDVLVFVDGQVADVNIMDVSLPCVKQKPSPDGDSSNGPQEDVRGRTTRVCTLILGCSIESHVDIMYEAKPPDVVDIRGLDDEWRLETVSSYERMQPRPNPHHPLAVAAFDFILVKNTSDTDIPIQLMAPSIMTSLAALGVFFLPPMAGERILMVGVAFLGQLMMVGFSVVAQIQCSKQGKLHHFMLFSTIYIFLVILAVLSSFFVYPLMKRFKTAKEKSTDEDGAQLLTITEKKFVSTIPDAIMFVIFIILYIVGMVTLFS